MGGWGAGVNLRAAVGHPPWTHPSIPEGKTPWQHCPREENDRAVLDQQKKRGRVLDDLFIWLQECSTKRQPSSQAVTVTDQVQRFA